MFQKRIFRINSNLQALGVDITFGELQNCP